MPHYTKFPLVTITNMVWVIKDDNDFWNLAAWVVVWCEYFSWLGGLYLVKGVCVWKRCSVVMCNLVAGWPVLVLVDIIFMWRRGSVYHCNGHCPWYIPKFYIILPKSTCLIDCGTCPGLSGNWLYWALSDIPDWVRSSWWLQMAWCQIGTRPSATSMLMDCVIWMILHNIHMPWLWNSQ